MTTTADNWRVGSFFAQKILIPTISFLNSQYENDGDLLKLDHELKRKKKVSGKCFHILVDFSQ